MHQMFRIGLIAIALLAIVLPARADLTLTVSEAASSTANLNALTPGESVTLDVTLSGLTTESIGFLGATLNFDASLLGTPLSITPGSIVPFDTSGFLTGPGPGVADASYYFGFNN